MTPPDDGRVARVMRYAVNCVPGNNHFALYVEFRAHRDGVDWYSVTNGWAFHTGGCYTLDARGRRAIEVKPTAYSPSWQKARQFPFERALEIAHQYAPAMIFNGFTVEDGLRMQAAREATDAWIHGEPDAPHDYDRAHRLLEGGSEYPPGAEVERGDEQGDTPPLVRVSELIQRAQEHLEHYGDTPVGVVVNGANNDVLCIEDATALGCDLYDEGEEWRFEVECVDTDKVNRP